MGRSSALFDQAENRMHAQKAILADFNGLVVEASRCVSWETYHILSMDDTNEGMRLP